MTEVTYRKGAMSTSAATSRPSPGPGGHLGELMAWDPVKQEKVWGVKERPAVQRRHPDHGRRPGVLRATCTACSAPSTRKTGKELWQMNARLGHRRRADHLHASTASSTSPWWSGRTASIPAFLGDIGKKMVEATPEGGALFVFTE